MKPLDERHHEAAAALATGTVAQAAEVAGVSVRTIHDWKKRDDFAALVRELKGREASHEPGALATLRELLKSDDESVRLRAAIALLNAGRGGVDPADDGGKAADPVSAAGLVIFDNSILEDDEPLPDGITQDETDHWRTALDSGWLGVDADALREMVEG